MADTLSDICDRLNGAGPELDGVGVGAFAFTLLAKGLVEDYATFVDGLVNRTDGSKPSNAQEKFRVDVLAEVKRLVSMVEGGLQAHARNLSRAAEPAPIVDLPKMAIDELPADGFRGVEHKLVPIHLPGGCAETVAAKTWSAKRFMEEFGAIEVSTNGAKSAKRPLAEFLRALIDTRGKHGEFMTTCDELFTAFPKLVDELEIPRIAARLGMGDEPNFANHMFVGGQMGWCGWHAAGDTNFYYVLNGEKIWYLAHPRHAAWFDPYMCGGSMRGHFAISPVDSAKSLERTADPPLPNGIPFYRVHLKPGDLLVVPPWWLHTVCSPTEFSIAVAARVTLPVLQNPEPGALTMTTVERLFPQGAHLMDLENWRFVRSD